MIGAREEDVRPVGLFKTRTRLLGVVGKQLYKSLYEDACRVKHSEKRNTGNAAEESRSKNDTNQCTKTHVVQNILENVVPTTQRQ